MKEFEARERLLIGFWEKSIPPPPKKKDEEKYIYIMSPNLALWRCVVSDFPTILGSWMVGIRARLQAYHDRADLWKARKKIYNDIFEL